MTEPLIQLTPNELNQVWQVLHRHLPHASDEVFYLFGSHTKGTATTTSDLDLLIKEAHPLPREIYYAIKDDFEYSELPFHVDVLDWYRLSTEFQNTLKDQLQPLPPAPSANTTSESQGKPPYPLV